MAAHQNASVIQTLNGTNVNIKLVRGEGFSQITLKNSRNSIMAVHACVKGFRGELFLSSFKSGLGFTKFKGGLFQNC